MEKLEWTWVAIIALIVCAYAVYSFSTVMATSSIEGKCSVKGIKLVDVRPAECWIDNINSRFCPIFTEIECGGSIDNLQRIMMYGNIPLDYTTKLNKPVINNNPIFIG